jgi:hypothetical protein
VEGFDVKMGHASLVDPFRDIGCLAYGLEEVLLVLSYVAERII